MGELQLLAIYKSLTLDHQMCNCRGALQDIGWSSMLVWALGAAPSKDTFWTSNQSSTAKVLAPECATGCPPDHTDVGCELHSMLAALSTGTSCSTL